MHVSPTIMLPMSLTHLLVAIASNMAGTTATGFQGRIGAKGDTKMNHPSKNDPDDVALIFKWN